MLTGRAWAPDSAVAHSHSAITALPGALLLTSAAYTLCGSPNGWLCKDLQGDPLACGNCGYICPGGAECQAGKCVCTAAGRYSRVPHA